MKCIKIALFCAATAIALPVQAATVSLNLTSRAPAFSDRQVNNADTIRAGGFSLTFQNIQSTFSSYGSVSFIGIGFGSFVGEITSVDLVFGTDTIIDRYDPDPFFRPGDSGYGFQLSGINGVSGLNRFDSRTRSAFDMGSIPVFLAGETYTLTHTLSGPSFATLAAFHVSNPPPVAAIPLPASLPLLLAGFGAIALLRRRA